jgi:hypothetical protein
LVGVSSFIGVFCLALWLIPNDLEISRWTPFAAFGLNLAMLIGGIVWRRRKPVEKPE